nr:unnamed protein product [Spirometra erinaceieuropaei]
MGPLILVPRDARSLLNKARGNRSKRRTALVARELARYRVDIAALSETRFSEQGQLHSLAGLAANAGVRKGQQSLATDNSPSTAYTKVEPTERKLSVLLFCFFVFSSFSSQNFGLDQCTLFFFRKHCNLMAPIL